MKPGKTPTPTALKRLRGNPGKRPLSDDDIETEKPDGIPNPPEYMPAGAKRIFRENIKKLYDMNIIRDVDVPAFAMACVCIWRHVEAEKQMKAAAKGKNPLTGALTRTPNDHVVYSAFLNLSHKSIELAYRMFEHFGMTPSARGSGRLEIKSNKKEADPLEEFLKSGGPKLVKGGKE